MIIFRQKLKNNIKDEIMCDEPNYESFIKFIEMVIDLDNKV